MKTYDKILQSKKLLIFTMILFVLGVYFIPYKQVINYWSVPPTVIYSSLANTIIYGLCSFSGLTPLLASVYWLVSLLSVAGLIIILYMLHSLKTRNIESNKLIITVKLFISLFFIESLMIMSSFFIVITTGLMNISIRYFIPVAFFIPIILLNLQALSLLSTPLKKAGRGLKVCILLTISIIILYVIANINT